MRNLSSATMSDARLESKEQPGNATLSYTSKYDLNKRPHNESLRVLSEEDWNFWKSNGYVVDVITLHKTKYFRYLLFT